MNDRFGPNQATLNGPIRTFKLPFCDAIITSNKLMAISTLIV